ncbi:MAG: alpha/beta hydrolase [Hyphomicrobiales bacterium]|nr:alpha/beta hydrolase [Hyphomicrobiales bacterium]MCP5001471.1 alpha/beta hydrolase [Hyphomicrobiales bacterium]
MDWIISLLVIAGLVIGASWYLAGFREKAMTPDERSAHAPGKSVPLSDGEIYYTERGPADGRTIVMVHGFGVPQFVFEQNASALANAGFRVVLFDHFGRGWSDRPRARYDTDFYDCELTELLEALKVETPVGLVGYSMGGVIVADYAAMHSERLAGVALLAPAGLAIYPFMGRLFGEIVRLPFIGDWLWRLRGRSLLLGDPQFQELQPDADRRIQGDDTIQMNYSGYFNALLQTWRNLPLVDSDDVFAKASKGVPMMALFGGRDLTINIESAARLKRAAPHAKVEIIEEGTHGLLYEMYDTVNPMLTDFFESNFR